MEKKRALSAAGGFQQTASASLKSLALAIQRKPDGGSERRADALRRLPRRHGQCRDRACSGAMGPYLAVITGVLSLPFTFFISNDAFCYGVVPILSQAAAEYGIGAASH